MAHAMDTDRQRTDERNRVAAMLLLLMGLIVFGGFGNVRTLLRDSADQTKVHRLQIDVNSADASEIALLPGIGPIIAKRVVADRNEFGWFEDAAELSRVHGVGPATVAKVSPYCVAESPSQHDGVHLVGAAVALSER